jgi:hypothetical protein
MDRPAAGAPPRHTLLQVLARWATGRHWHGRALSDATFFRDGTQGEAGYWGSGRESRWVLLAGWKRAAVRLAVLAAAVGLWRWRTGTEWVLALTGGPLAGLGAWRCAVAVRLWRHRATLERPMASALAPFLGVPPRTVEAALAVEPGFEAAAGGEHVAALELPDHWAATADQKARVEEVIRARIGIDLKPQWQTSRYPMVLNMLRAPTPPARVLFADQRALMEACPPGRVFLGLDANGEPRYWDRSLEDPMVAIHGGSRRGKTSLLVSIAGQDIRRGAERVTGIDPKRVSLLPLAELGPAVRLYNDPRNVEGMWQGVAEFRALVEERYDALADDPTLEFRRALLLIDEVSQCSGMWSAHWHKTGGKGKPPVWDDVAAAVWMGAQANANVIVGGQRLDYQILGGMLGSFGVRMLAGYMPQDYARLVGQTPYIRSQKPRGRFLLYAGDELDWVQLVKVDDPDRDFSGFCAWVREGLQDAPDLAAAGGTGTGAATAGTVLIVGLAAAAAHLGMNPEAFKKARQRRAVPGEIATPDGRPAWPPDVLAAWRAGHGAGVSS